MKKGNIIGIVISLIGLFMMGYQIGVNAKTGENDSSLTVTGLLIVFVGAFIAYYLSKKKPEQ